MSNSIRLDLRFNLGRLILWAIVQGLVEDVYIFIVKSIIFKGLASKSSIIVFKVVRFVSIYKGFDVVRFILSINLLVKLMRILCKSLQTCLHQRLLQKDLNKFNFNFDAKGIENIKS